MRSLKLQLDYLNSLTLSNVGELSWGWIPNKNIQAKKKEKDKFFVHC